MIEVNILWIGTYFPKSNQVCSFFQLKITLNINQDPRHQFLSGGGGGGGLTSPIPNEALGESVSVARKNKHKILNKHIRIFKV